jgi:hypothetical protein
MSNRIAKYLRDVNPDARGHQKLYHVEPPTEFGSFDPESPRRTTSFVVVSKACTPYSGWETYIFPANAEGMVVDWGELPGSWSGHHSHEATLQNAGYEVQDGE